MAQTLGISVATLSKYENGLTTPKTETLEKIAAMLKIPVKELYRTGSIEEGREQGFEVGRTWESAVLDMDELLAFSKAIETVKHQYDLSQKDHQTLANLVEISEQMLRKLDHQSNSVKVLQSKLDVLRELLTSYKEEVGKRL